MGTETSTPASSAPLGTQEVGEIGSFSKDRGTGVGPSAWEMATVSGDSLSRLCSQVAAGIAKDRLKQTVKLEENYDFVVSEWERLMTEVGTGVETACVVRES
jgi:hypothetical protein